MIDAFAHDRWNAIEAGTVLDDELERYTELRRRGNVFHRAAALETRFTATQISRAVVDLLIEPVREGSGEGKVRLLEYVNRKGEGIGSTHSLTVSGTLSVFNPSDCFSSSKLEV